MHKSTHSTTTRLHIHILVSQSESNAQITGWYVTIVHN